MIKTKNQNRLLGFKASVSTQIENYAAHLIFNEVNEAQDKKSVHKRQNYTQSVLMDTIYSEECVNFGHKFQLIENIYFKVKQGKHDILGLSFKDLYYYSGDTRFDAVMFMVESAFQMACVNGLLTHKGLGIPSQFESLEIFNIDFKFLKLVPELLENARSAQGFFCNVYIYNEDDKCIGVLKKLEMIPIKNFEQFPIRFEDKVHVI